MNKKKYIIFIFIISIIALSYFAYDSFAHVVIESIPSIEIKSKNANYDRKEAGAWKVTKSAKWIDKDKARITFNVDTVAKSDNLYRDFVLVLDTSVSMEGNKIDILKGNVKELINDILSDQDNRISLINFDTESEILSPLSNNSNMLINLVDTLSPSGNTNYYQALVNVEKVLDNTVDQDETIVLFLTDGYPNINTPNEVAQYKYLKNKYSDITFTGIQYEMGDKVLKALKNISDIQYISNKDSLHNVLFDAVKNHLSYDSFVIEDYINIDDFNIVGDSIKVIGDVSIENDKLLWKISNLKSGSIDSYTLSLDVKLKNENNYIYSTNTSTKVISKIGDLEEDVIVNDSPILINKYTVEYDLNLPKGCNINNPSNKNYSVFSTVKIEDNKYECDGYKFKNWELVTDGVEKINDHYFIMPEKDVKFKGTWSKLAINKSADGTISKVQTLYNIMKEQAVPDNIASTYVKSATGIDFTKISSDSNGKGVYEMSSTHNNDYPIYYYRGDIVDNNVLFADMCFKAMLSTDTGGVKLIYNGLPENGKCSGTDDTTIGDSKYNPASNSLAYFGYMYGKPYVYNYKEISADDWNVYIGKDFIRHQMLNSRESLKSTMYYYADDVFWDEDNSVYELKNKDGSELVKSEWSENSKRGYYTCFSGSRTSCSEVYYISGGTDTIAYYIKLSGGKSINNYIYLSKDISYDSINNMYTLNNPVSASDWYTTYSNYIGYYVCKDINTTTCSEVYYITDVRNWRITALSMTNGETYESSIEAANNVLWKYGNDVIYNTETGMYTLKDTIEFSPMKWVENYKNLNNNHYTCFSTSNSCSEVYYIYYAQDLEGESAIYLTLSNGTKINDALSEMLDDNTTNSTIKTVVDKWYSENFGGYTDYIEDTVYCNDRSVYQYNGWNYNGGNITDTLKFNATNRTKPDISCVRDVDRFSVSNNIGNGELIYPVGLLTVDEVRLAGGLSGISNKKYYLHSNSITYWLNSPSFFGRHNSFAAFFANTGYISSEGSNNNFAVRPVISLKPGTRIEQGDGTVSDPYQIETED